MSNIQVGILMGSDSDWPKIKGAAAALDEFDIGYEVHVMSAHRTPEKVLDYASGARARGLGVIIAAAGGAAHLAGVVASHTTLPVIGIPVETGVMGGLDSLRRFRCREIFRSRRSGSDRAARGTPGSSPPRSLPDRVPN